MKAKVHSETGEVLIPISPLIGRRGEDGTLRRVTPDQPLHAMPQRHRPPKRQVELSPLHDFMAKLLQPEVLPRLLDYVRWQRAWRDGHAAGMSLEDALESAPVHAPLSINLDLTTACNFRCDHCVDMDILNTGIRYEHDQLMASLTRLAEHGLKSVILIGGGEPTAYPKFGEVVRHLKSLGLKIGVVTNGSLMKRVHDVADVLEAGDWVRLSLDSADNETFRRMHKPALERCTLDWICEHIPPIKDKNPAFQIGYSFIIVWDHCEANDTTIVENLDEIHAAAERAKRYRFDYISYKPFLTRAEENNAEVIDLTRDEDHLGPVIKRIRSEIGRAKALEGDGFRVVESTNLRVLENGTHGDYTDQPRTCHMQFFRQVVSPLGVYNCPVYRHVPHAMLGQKDAYAGQSGVAQTQRNTLRLIESFDASHECRNVTCLYNHANWFIEDLIRDPGKLDALVPGESRGDYFL